MKRGWYFDECVKVRRSTDFALKRAWMADFCDTYIERIHGSRIGLAENFGSHIPDSPKHEVRISWMLNGVRITDVFVGIRVAMLAFCPFVIFGRDPNSFPALEL